MADQQARSKLSGASGDMRRHIIDELARPVEDRGRDYALAGILLPIVLFWIGALPYQSDVLRFPIALVVALIPAPISFFYWRSMQTFANQIRKFVQTDSG